MFSYNIKISRNTKQVFSGTIRIFNDDGGRCAALWNNRTILVIVEAYETCYAKTQCDIPVSRKRERIRI